MLLGGLSALALGSFVGCDADVDQDMTGHAAGGPASGTQAGVPGAARASVTGNRPPPYTLASQSVLSEDYFLLKPGTFDPAHDKVAAYVHDDAGQLEAMTVQEGVLSQLFHDADADGSWAMAPVKVGGGDLVGVLDVVAGRPLGPDGAVGRLHVFCRTASAVLHLVQQPDRSWTSTDLGWLDPKHATVQQPLQVSESPTGGMVVYYWFQQLDERVQLALCVVEKTDGAETVASNPNVLQSLNITKRGYGSVVRLSRANGSLQLYWFGGDSYLQNVTLVDLTEELQLLTSRPMCASGTLRMGLSGATFRAAFSVSESEPPFAVADDDSGSLFRLTYDPDSKASSKPWTWSPLWDAPAEGYGGLLATGIRGLAKAESQSATDRADKVLDLYPLLKSSLSIMRQVPSGDAVADSTAPVFSPLLGLQGGVQAVSVPTTRGAGAGLMFLNTAGELQVLTQDAVSGAWSTTPVHLPATEHLQLSTYRTQLSLTDAWAQPVRGGALQVTADVPTPAMVGGDPVFLHPGTPVTVSTDQTGRVTVAVPAEGLDTAALTVTGQLAAPVTIKPNAVVNGFLTGTGALNGMPALTATGFAAAPIGPGGGKIEADRADAGFAVISNAAKAGIPKAERTGDQRRIHQTGHHDHRHDNVVVRGLEWSLSGFADEIGHAIVTGAAEVGHAVVTTVVDVATKVASWAVELTVTCGELVDQVLTIAVTDLRSAAHVIHGALAWVGAEVGSFVRWLEAKILAVLTDTVHVAAQYESWVRTAVGTFLPGEVKAGKAAIAAELVKVQGLVDSALTTLASTFGGQSLADMGAAPAASPRGLRGTSTAPPPDTDTAHGSWLMEKLQSVFSGVGITLATPAALTLLHDDLQKDSAKALDEFTGAVQELWTTLRRAMSRPQDIPTYGMSHLVDSFRKLVDSVFALATLVSDLVCDAVLAALSLVSSVLDASIGDLPLIGPLLTGAGLGGDLTAVKLVTLIMAFPTVVAYKVRHGADAVPFAALQARGARELPGVSGETVDADLKFAATSAMLFWGFADSISAVLSLDDDAVRGPRGALGGSVSVWGIIDVIAPAVVTTLTIPRQPTHWPFADPVDLEDGGGTFNGGVSWLIGYFPMIAAVIPMCYASDDPRKVAIDQEALCMTSLMSAVALFFGIRGNVDSKSAVSAAAWGATVLGALPGIGCIGLTEPVQKATGEMSVPLQAANCLIVGGLAAAAYSYAS